jgi:hypothetical protein
MYQESDWPAMLEAMIWKLFNAARPPRWVRHNRDRVA